MANEIFNFIDKEELKDINKVIELKQEELRLIQNLNDNKDDALIELGIFYVNKHDDCHAIKIFKDAKSKRKLTHSEQTFLSMLYFESNHFNLGYEACIDAANEGDGLALFYIGTYYEFIKGKKRSLSKALEWYSKSAETGYVGALERVADMYFNGEGTKVDQEKAAQLYELASNRDSVESQLKLYKYYNSLNNKELASKYLDLACGHNHPDALYFKGSKLFVAGRYDAALPILEESMHNGSVDAAFLCAMAYLNGDRIPKDIDKAMECLQYGDTAKINIVEGFMYAQEGSKYFSPEQSIMRATYAQIAVDRINSQKEGYLEDLGEPTLYDFDLEKALRALLKIEGVLWEKYFSKK